VEYYKIHQLVRSVQGLGYLTEYLDWQTPITLNLGYRAVIDLHTCLAMTEASGAAAALSTPRVLPQPREGSLQLDMARQIEHFVVPQLGDKFAVAIATGHASLARHLDLRERYGGEFEAQELASLRHLLGTGVRDLAGGRRELIRHIETLDPQGETPVLAHLTDVALQQASLMAPLVGPWGSAGWARFDP
jgi:hypothetical protein